MEIAYETMYVLLACGVLIARACIMSHRLRRPFREQKSDAYHLAHNTHANFQHSSTLMLGCISMDMEVTAYVSEMRDRYQQAASTGRHVTSQRQKHA